MTNLKAKKSGFQRQILINTLPGRLVAGGQGLIQVIVGPRQVGKTTAIHHFLANWKDTPAFYESADLLSPPDGHWISENWEKARALAGKSGRAVLVLDEIQKISRWSEVVKGMFDEDRRRRISVHVILLGSSALLVQRGLTESLAGRFEVIFFPHWSFAECSQAFGWDLNTWLFFGGYPGGANLLAEEPHDEKRWQQYIRESLIETVLNKDILLLTPVDKPALFRQVFQLACAHPAEIVALTKMLGQLHDAGNVTTIASYLNLLASAQLILPLPKYSGERIRQRAASPKFLILNNALINATMARLFDETIGDPAVRGRLVENAVGAHLFNQTLGSGTEIFYWREGDHEVDFVVRRGNRLWAVEVKSNGRGKMDGIRLFLKRYPTAKAVRVGGKGAEISLEDFLNADPIEMLSRP